KLVLRCLRITLEESDKRTSRDGGLVLNACVYLDRLANRSADGTHRDVFRLDHQVGVFRRDNTYFAIVVLVAFGDFIFRVHARAELVGVIEWDRWCGNRNDGPGIEPDRLAQDFHGSARVYAAAVDDDVRRRTLAG